MAHVIAISATPALSNSVEEFIQSVEHGRDNSADKYIAMVDHLTDRMLTLFLVEPREFLALPGGQKRVIDFAISTAGKASHMLTRQIYKKKKPDELQGIAANMNDMYWPPGPENGEHPCLTYPVDDGFAGDFTRAAESATAGQGTAEIALVRKVMDRLADDIIEHFFLRNSREVKIGYVTRKALDVGIDGTKKAVHAVNNKVLGDLDNEQLKLFMGHYESLLKERT